jgi:hypothetical protein
MPQKLMEHNTGNYGSVYGTIATVILYAISHFGLSDLAAAAAIFAGFTTGAYNIYKFIKDQKHGNTEHKER